MKQQGAPPLSGLFNFRTTYTWFDQTCQSRAVCIAGATTAFSTSGGANSYWNLLIYLIEKYTDKEMAIRTSKYFEIERNRDSQSLFTIFEGSKLHDDGAILAAQAHIENFFGEKLIVDYLVDLVHVSRRSFQRRFRKATHFTVKEYIQRIRIEAAKKLLEENRLTINEIMYQSGYNDAKAFRYVFNKVSGVSPLTYRRKFK